MTHVTLREVWVPETAATVRNGGNPEQSRLASMYKLVMVHWSEILQTHNFMPFGLFECLPAYALPVGTID